MRDDTPDGGVIIAGEPLAPGGEKIGGAEPRPIAVFAHLARNKDALRWRAARDSGKLVGVNDETPYGYARAERMGCRVTFSRSDRESKLGALFRLAIRAIAGFDLIHALRQKDALLRADMIWTHTESQYLAVAATLLLTRARPKLLGQSVWLMDRWQSLGFVHRAVYRRLIDRVDVMTFHSPSNLALAKKLFPGKRMALVRFGIATEQRVAPRPRPSNPIRVLSLGNDRDRDWQTLFAAARDHSNLSVLVLSGSVPARLARGAGNVTIRQARTNDDLTRSFEDATVVCVPLRPNLHASGITVIQEAVLAGVPVIASDVGGLDAYFARDEICFVPSGDVAALREALLATARDPEGFLDRARRAQARMIDGSLGAGEFIRSHVDLTREILNR